MDEKHNLELTDEEVAVLKDLIRMYAEGRKAAVKAVVAIVVGAIFSLLSWGVIHWIRTITAATSVLALMAYIFD